MYAAVQQDPRERFDWLTHRSAIHKITTNSRSSQIRRCENTECAGAGGNQEFQKRAKFIVLLLHRSVTRWGETAGGRARDRCEPSRKAKHIYRVPVSRIMFLPQQKFVSHRIRSQKVRAMRSVDSEVYGLVVLHFPRRCVRIAHVWGCLIFTG